MTSVVTYLVALGLSRLSTAEVANTTVTTNASHSADPCYSYFNFETTSNILDEYMEIQYCDIWQASQWRHFRDNESKPLEILTFKNEDKFCIQTNQCNSKFPWYIQLPAAGATDYPVLCMTSKADNQRQQCCQNKVEISIKNCPDKIIYKIKEAIPSVHCGRICVGADGETQDIRDSYIVYSNHLSRQWLDRLPANLRDNVLTIVLRIDVSSLQERETIKSLEEAIVKLWNLKAADRQIKETDIVTVYNSPQSEGRKLYYIFYIRSGNGTAILASEVTNILQRLRRTDPAGLGTSSVLNIRPGVVPATARYTSPQTTTTTSAVPTSTAQKAAKLPGEISESDTPAESKSANSAWKGILIIMGIALVIGTGIVVVAVFHVCKARG